MNKKLFLKLSFFITLIGCGFQNTQAMDEREKTQPQTQSLNKRPQEFRDELIREEERQIKVQEGVDQLKTQYDRNDETQEK